MTNKEGNLSSDFIAMANPKLARKINKKNKLKESLEEASNNIPNLKAHSSAHHRRFKDEIWRTVSILNIFRYLFALSLLILCLMPLVNEDWRLFEQAAHQGQVLIAAIVLLISAVCLIAFARAQNLDFYFLMLIQFSLDLIMLTLIMHASGGIQNHFIVLYFAVVTTGSVVLRRRRAIALASGATLLLFFEHFYTVLISQGGSQFTRIAFIGTILMISAWFVSYLAQRLRQAELQTFSPGEEPIEEFLTREEVNALKIALQKTNGNKTEAAKLLGMTFRSFRYKLTKYDIA